MSSRVPDSLIGLMDGPTDNHHTSFLTNKVGGEPDWPPLISRQLPRCGSCGAPSAHLVQVYCPLAASPYHRNLHLFACPRSACSGRSESWSALRSQSLEAAGTSGQLAPPREAARPATDWCESADDWGVAEEDGWGGVEQEVHVHEEAAAPQTGVAQTDVSRGLQSLRLAEPRDVHVYRPFFISVLDESDLGGGDDDDDDDLEHARELLREYEEREGLRGPEEARGGGEEEYEKAGVRHGDAVFSRFMKTISACPQQILRYCRGGAPLFVSEPPSNMARLVPACSSCGASRTFELQLMPALVSLLQSSGGSELDFGTVLVYTCSGSCWAAGSDSAVDEFCFVQADPDQQLFK